VTPRVFAAAHAVSDGSGGSTRVPPVLEHAQRPDFETVYAENAQFVWRTLARLGVPESALADATQEVFLVAYRRLGDFEGRSSIRTWLFGIAMRVASHSGRQARRRPTEPLTDTLPAEHEHGEAPFEQAARSEAVKALYALLATLSPAQRAVFVLVELEQMSVPEAAEAIGANLNTVTSRLRVARQNFAAALRRYRATNERRGP
jgi:RNA polymerase sigma-70 factor (ECF subfamily)